MIITAIIGTTGLIIEMQREASIDAFQTATMNLGNGMAQQTAHSLGFVDQALSELQARLTSAPDQTAGQIKAEMQLKSTFDAQGELRKRVSGLEALSAVDADGGVATTSRGFPSPAIDFSGRDFFSHFKADDDHAVYFGTPVKDPASGKWSAFMARRVDDGHGGFAGLVVAEISLSDIQEFYQLAMPARRSVYLLRQDGVVLVRYPQQDDEIGKKIPEQSPWYTVVVHGGGTYHAPMFFGTTSVIAAVRPLRNLPIVVEASVTETDVLMEWYQRRIWVIAGAISSIICVIALLRLFGGQYCRLKLSEMSLAAKNSELDIAHGRLDATLANLTQGVCFYNDERQLIVYNQRYCELYDLAPESVYTDISMKDILKLHIAD